MNSLKILSILIIFSGILCAFSNHDELSHNLDIKAYWEAASNDEQLYPSPKQMDMLKKVIPESAFQPAPPASDRDYWNKMFATSEGKAYYENAISELEIEPEVPISDSIYRIANLKGIRPIYKPRYYRTMTRLEHFILAECMENQGRFIPQIEVYINAIMDMKSWLHPNHDNSDNDVLEGRSRAIDLGARRFGSDLALAEVLLSDKLSDELRKDIATNLRRRIIDTYLKTCSGEEKTHLTWFRGTSNWNSVCTSGSMFVSIATSNDPDERRAAVGCALNSMKNYLNGFGDDGYCSEGAGYWNYGFGHYLYLAEILYDYSKGAIDLFKADNPEKLKNIGNFPERYQIHKGICAPFSDGVSRVSNDGGFAYNMSVRHFGAAMPPASKKSKSHDSFSAAFQLIEWDDMGSATDDGSTKLTNQELPDHTYFDDVGMVISRGKQEVPLSIAIKAGHNAENHNHSDVGTYTLVLNKDIVTGDIGAPSYIAGAFAEDNPARSSWGHPVPRIDNTLQSNGRKFAGKITSAEFTESYDKVVMDLKAAYEIPSLTALTRTMENDKSGQGLITITDQFSSTKPVAFGVAIMTLSHYEIVGANTIILTTKNQKLKAEFTSPQGSLLIKDELVPVEHLREGGPAYRIGIDFTEPIREGSIMVKYYPVGDGKEYDNFKELSESPDWKLQFSDPCTKDWQSNWFLDGQLATIKHGEKGMDFSAGPVNRNDAHHAVLWTKESFKGDIKIEYNYTRTDSQMVNVNILYIQATGIGRDSFETDISKWNEFRKVPTMSKYYNYMKTIHISYAAFNMVNDDPDADYIRIRQYPVTEKISFDDMEIPPAYYETGLFRTGVTYKMTWIKTKSKLYLKVEGNEMKKEYSWDLNKPESITEGRIGLRHMYTRSANYSDFKVYVKN
ncbi:MAG: hypothetical protein DHS20C18_39760 [Saprospiraceae bacterium]|nr:MAG: hypothetical protein DHS20C18_39760 [Saprospiraceae bacterium]